MWDLGGWRKVFVRPVEQKTEATKTSRENAKKDKTETVAQATPKWWYRRRAIRLKAEGGVNSRVPSEASWGQYQKK